MKHILYTCFPISHWYPCTRTGTSTEEAADVSAFKKQTSCASKLEKVSPT